MNSPTLTEFRFDMIRRADIEGSKATFMNAWPPQASYPCGNFSGNLPILGFFPSLSSILLGKISSQISSQISSKTSSKISRKISREISGKLWHLLLKEGIIH